MYALEYGCVGQLLDDQDRTMATQELRQEQVSLVCRVATMTISRRMET